MKTKAYLSSHLEPSLTLKMKTIYVAAGILVFTALIGTALFLHLTLGNASSALSMVASSTYTSSSSGNWSTGTVWVGGVAPSADLDRDDVIVTGSHSITRIGNITGQSDVRLTIQPGATLTINGNFTVQNNLILDNRGTLIITGTFTAQNGASVTVQGGGNMTLQGGATFGNNTALVVNGNLNSGGNITFGNNSVFNGSGSVNVSGSGCSAWTGTGTCNSGPIILPVELLSFKAKDNGNGTVQISWETATEKNNDYFTVQRSTDGVAYSDIATIKGNGTKKTKTRYQQIDAEPVAAKLYYRLSQTDFDGTTEIFSPVFTEVALMKSAIAISAYPNPMTGTNLTIKFSQAGAGTVQVADQRGNTVLTKEVDGSSSELALEFNQELSPGLYYVHYKADGVTTSTKVVKR